MLLLFYTVSCIAQATIQKSLLPYSEVWGYDLSEFPAVKWGLAGVMAYAMDDGDIWFAVDYSYKKTNPMGFFSPTTDDQYVLIKVFKGEQTILNAQEREKLFEITEGKKIYSGYPHQKDIMFSDGSKLSVYHGSMTKRCFVPDFMLDYIVKTDAQGKEKNYSILAASTQVSIQ